MVYRSDGKVLRIDGKVAGGPDCCCPGTCAVSVSCETASAMRGKCGSSGFQDTVTGAFWKSRFIGCGVSDDDWVYSVPTDDTHAWARLSITRRNCETGEITQECGETQTPIVPSLGGPECQLEQTCIGPGPPQDPTESELAVYSDEYTTAQLISDLLSELPAYSGGVCMAAFALSDTTWSAAVTALRYTISVTAGYFARWNEAFTPAGGGAPTSTPRETTSLGTLIYEIVPDGSMEGTWTIENLRCEP